MPDKNIAAPTSDHAPDGSPKSGEAPSPTSTGIEENKAFELSQDANKTPSSLSPQNTTEPEGSKEQRKSPRFRVGWHTDILFDDQSTHHGFINDISTLGASIFLDNSLIPEKSTLHIHVPPLNLTSEPHIIAVSGRTVYVVYDGDQQLFRAAFVFLKFHLESDLTYLNERLTKYQSEIHEKESSHKIQEL